MKNTIRKILFTVISMNFLAFSAFAAEYLIPGGQVIGLELQDRAVTVAAFDEVLGQEARAAGLRIGDEILSIDGQPVDATGDVRKALIHSDGGVDVTISRKGKNQQLHLSPSITPEGPKLGVLLRQGITGIGTVTWYDPASQAFGTLGHGVNGAGGRLLEMQQGCAYPATVDTVKVGKSGDPGQLRGVLDGEKILGKLSKNTAKGVFGVLDQPCHGGALPVAAFSDIHPGEATIRCTVSQAGVQEYGVEIVKLQPHSDGRELVLKVTDPALLQATGGIVQGMSGSPIIQNGKLIGAVTHVLVNDPTRGYGISIENMLEAAG